MGKRDNRVAFINPIAAARSSGPPPSTGPTIKDYLSRPRPTLEEVQHMMKTSSASCGVLAQWEEKMHKEEKLALQKQRDQILGKDEKSKSKKKKKKKEKKHRRARSRSRSRSPLPRKYSESESESELERDSKRGRRDREKRDRDRRGGERSSSRDSRRKDKAKHRKEKVSS